MSAFESFLTGFLGRSADIIKERKDKGEDYFDSRLERARTIGLDNVRARREQQQGMLTLSRNLMNDAGMPEHVVRALANEGPEALQHAHEIYMQNVSNGQTVDENFWNQTYNFSQEVLQNSDMSLNDFLGQVVGLYPSNLQATTQEGGDPFGAFVASGLGLNAMDRARDKLMDWEVAEGFSAADILDTEQRPQNTRPLGDTGYAGPNYSFVADQLQEGPRPLSLTEQDRIYNTFDRDVEAKVAEFKRRAADGEFGEISPQDLLSPNFMRDEAEAEVAATLVRRYGPEIISQLPTIWSLLPMEDEAEEQGDEITVSPLPPSTQELEEAGIGNRESVVQPGDTLTNISTGTTYTIVDQTDTGVVVENNNTGQQEVMETEGVIQGLQSGEIQYQVGQEPQGTTSPHLDEPDLPAPSQQVFTTGDGPSKTYTLMEYVDGNMVFRDDSTSPPEYFLMTTEEYRAALQGGTISGPTTSNMFGLGAMSPPSIGPSTDDW